MKLKRVLEACLAAALFGLASGALASPAVELKDGSRIEGEIQSITNGVYTVLSPSLGTVHIPQSSIARIVYDGAPAASSAGASSAPDDGLSLDIAQIGKRLAQDPDAMQSIMSLQSDPQIQAILADPAITRAIQEGDYASLMANPKIRALESNSRVKQLVQQQVR
ncbi:hypothetical protein [Tahibacter amnicola]|uniref:STI1 domain-containing protein n=1 Tax=Tahibacter amnicola TaxID=2976241 RepID=A0ABY6BJV4_9GAMM|nr:hypothetical protein [Tahibacter amnicola]UXI70296.1 hypothetical protein N4264_11865 [Tahibacter amnicola]